MRTKSQSTPVLIIIFNRPDKVKKLISALAKIKPRHVYIAGDGPRAHKATDPDRCQEARKVATTIPWECNVHTNFQNTNLGCKYGVSTAISWFFEQVPEGIILEDDCIPDPSFFEYATQMLDRYRDTKEIMHINGHSFITEKNITVTSPYYFSRIPHVWGWATWQRAWALYDINMSELSTLSTQLSRQMTFIHKRYSTYWIDLLQHVQRANIDTWDAQWVYSIMKQDGVCITPTVNMIENVGFDEEATHTKEKFNKNHNVSAFNTHNFTHPTTINIQLEYDSIEMETIFLPKGWSRFRSYVKKIYYFVTEKLLKYNS